MNKFLFVPMGETFRYRFDGDPRGRGGIESYNLQMEVSNSHLKLLNQINNDCETDIFYHFYGMNSQYDEDLVNLYPSKNYNVDGAFTNGLIGEVNFYNKTYDLLGSKDLSEYKSILFVRADFFLKPYFKNVYDHNDQRILFTHVNEICRGYHLDPDGVNPFVNYMIFHVPNRFFDKLLNGQIMNYHSSYAHCLRNGLSHDDIWFILDTYHSSNTEYVWNPIFHQVGRPENKEWIDRGYRVNPETRQPYFIENDNIYSNLKNNDFYN